MAPTIVARAKLRGMSKRSASAWTDPFSPSQPLPARSYVGTRRAHSSALKPRVAGITRSLNSLWNSPECGAHFAFCAPASESAVQVARAPALTAQPVHQSARSDSIREADARLKGLKNPCWEIHFR